MRRDEYQRNAPTVPRARTYRQSVAYVAGMLTLTCPTLDGAGWVMRICSPCACVEAGAADCNIVVSGRTPKGPLLGGIVSDL
jgi:hypothetical protein